jgi:hypothetical protein
MWTAEFTVEFTPLPKEMEEEYWFAIHYFAEVMFSDLAVANVDEPVKESLDTE